MFKVVLGYAIVFLLCQTVSSPATAQPDSNRLVIIRDVAVVDVELGRVLPHRTVTIVKDRIQSVDLSSARKAPPDALVIEGNGMFLMPGLFDSHVHLNNPDRDTKMLLANGVVFVRDMGGDTGERIATRKQARVGMFNGLEMICVGTILDGDPPYHPWSRRCATPEEGRAAVREMKIAGVDQIKVYSLLKPEVHRAICAEAKKQKLKVVGHVPDSMTLEEATFAGQQGVEHLSGFKSLLSSFFPAFTPVPGEFDGGVWTRYPDLDKARLRERLSRLASAGVAHCPTLVLHAGQARILDENTKALWNLYALPDDRNAWSATPYQYAAYGRTLATAFPFMQLAVTEMHRSGLPLLVGTDLGNPGILAGFSVHEEMRLWQNAGLRPADILRAATLTPARFFGVADRFGSVERGKTASFVLTRKNPLDDIRNAAAIEAVFARGNYFDKAALDRFLADAREDVRARSTDPTQKIKLEVPGQVVAQGRYELFYEQYPDGTETFRITRDGDRHRLIGVRQQAGFGRYPVVQTAEWNRDSIPTEATLKPVVLQPTVESYRVYRSRLIGKATRDTRTITETSGEFSRDFAIRSPLTAMDYFLFQRIRMKVGETKRVETYLLERADWKPERQSITVFRDPDETIEIGAGQKILCQHYRTTGGKNKGVKMEIWLDPRGIPVKQIVVEGGAKRSAVFSPTRSTENR